jgi:hypothetical protein
MSSDNIENYQETENMVEDVDDISEKGKIHYFLKRWRKALKTINKKYSKPRLKMTPLVKVSLLALRLYLIMLVIILSYKFYTMVM